MSQGFYELLGVNAGASVEVVRTAYTQRMAQLLKRRRTVLEQGGDVAPIDLTEARVQDAWDVLSDPARRRRYDALVALSGQDLPADDEDALWELVAGALISPSAAAAAALLDRVTDLRIGRLPDVPGATPTPREPDEEVTITMTSPRVAPRPEPLSAAVPRSEPELRVVDGASGPPVIRLPDPPSRAATRDKPSISAEDLARMVERHGYSGALLGAVRSAQGITLEQMGETTRISVRYLEAIEAEQADVLPSATFVRGYVREMARQLGLVESEIVAGYMQRFTE